MIEKTILKYLKERMSIPIYMEQPEKKPKEFVIIEKAGKSGKQGMLYHSIFIFQSYSTSLLKAAELSEKVCEVMENSIECDEICRAKINSEYNFTDMETKKYRYQAVFDITHY